MALADVNDGSRPSMAGRLTANILLVDDSGSNLTALEALFAPLGVNAMRATSGEGALREVLKHDFAVILMDVRMPGMDGFETAALIRTRAKSAHIPIIFITGVSKDHAAICQGYELGAVDYIAKPFDTRILLSKVKVFVDLYKKNEQVRVQTQLILEAGHREKERIRLEREREQEQERLRAMKLELELRVAERTAQLVEANSEMEAFCYSVSHDLRAPLRAIISTSRILLQDAHDKLSESEVDQLKRQSNAAKKLSFLIDDLLHLSRIGRKQLDPIEVDLTLLVEEVASELTAKYLDHAVRVVVEPGLTAFADLGFLKILFRNLLDNAFKYSPAGGEVRVGRSEQGHFFVKDFGIGFDPQYASRLFLPFERLVSDQLFPGTGIGLAIVHRIIRRHSGEIWAEGVVGQGSTFYFTLG